MLILRILGLAGPVVIILSYAMATVAGIRLAYCWTMVQDLDPTLRNDVRTPYPTIGFHAYGKFGE